MGRLLIVALVLVAAWYGWTRHDQWRARGTDEWVFRNRTGVVLDRMRVSVHGQAWAMERLARDTTIVLKVRSEEEGPFELEWKVRDVEKHWSGGSHVPGPIRMRQRFDLVPGDGVVWTSERLPAKEPRKAKRDAR